MTERGKLIVVEGADGSGKTTAAKLLRDHLFAAGKAVEMVNILRDDPVSAKIRAVLTDPENTIHPDAEACLYAAAVTNVYRHVVLPLLETGVNVICDRNQLSTWAYQVAPQITVGNLRPRDIFNAAYDDIKPDLLFMLFVDSKAGLSRVQGRDGKLDRLELRGSEYQDQVQQAYRHYCDSVFDKHSVYIYHNNESIEELERFIGVVAGQV